MRNKNILSVLFTAVIVFLAAMHIGQNSVKTEVAADEVGETSLPFVITEQPLASVVSVFETDVPVVLAKYLWNDGAAVDKNTNQRWAMASLTKLMTAVVASENLKAETPVTIDEEAWASEGTAGDFLPGEIFTAGDLIKAMLVVSSNDAAEALARSYGREKFIAVMRAKAAELGMNATNYADVTGLLSLNQSTAADLEKLTRYIYSGHPEIFDITREREVAITDLRSKIKRKLVNINKFAGRDYFLGGKTGFTDEAGGNLISLLRYDNQPLLVIVMGSGDRFADTEKVFNWVTSH